MEKKSMFYNRLNTLVIISGKSMNFIEMEHIPKKLQTVILFLKKPMQHHIFIKAMTLITTERLLAITLKKMDALDMRNK